MFNSFNEFFSLDSGAMPRVVEMSASKRLNREIHSPGAPPPIVNSVRGGKTMGKDEVE